MKVVRRREEIGKTIGAQALIWISLVARAYVC
jgi:hypothetical protein